MLLSPPAPWPRVRLNRLPHHQQCKGRPLSLPRSRRPRTRRRLGACMAEMARIEGVSSRELGISIGEESDVFLGGERLAGPRRERDAAASETWRVPVEAALNRMIGYKQRKNQEDTEGSRAAPRHRQPPGAPARAPSIAEDDEDRHPEPSPTEKKNSLPKGVEKPQHPPAPPS